MRSTARTRIGVQAPLGFSAGLPPYLIGGTLVAWLATEGVNVKALGLFALVSLPYNLKFLWAPFVDRYCPPFLGRRRGWIAVMQVAVAAAVALLATLDVAGDPLMLAAIATLVATLSATQDIAVDAYRTDSLGEDERGKGTATYVAGYRIALIVTGSGALVLSDYVSWQVTYYILAALSLAAVIPTVLAPEPDEIPPPSSMRAAVVEPLRAFFTRKNALVALAFVMLFKIGDLAARDMITPFLLDIDFSRTEIGLIQKALGMGATIVGAIIGGVLVDRIGVLRGLLIFGAAQAFANAGYLVLTLTGKDYTTLLLAIGIDNICNGLGTAAFVAFLMSLCDHQFSATQYALFTSASSLLGRFSGAVSGYVIASVGWGAFFALTIGVAVPALALLLRPDWIGRALPTTSSPPPAAEP